VDAGEAVRDAIGDELFAGMYTNATMHTPENVTLDALKFAEKAGADCVVSTVPLNRQV